VLGDRVVVVAVEPLEVRLGELRDLVAIDLVIGGFLGKRLGQPRPAIP